MGERSVAILTIHNAGDFSPKGKAEVLAWLKKQVKSFEKDNLSFARTFRARYLYAEGDYSHGRDR